MSRKKRTEDEKICDSIRTVSLMHELSSRAGTDNPNQFAKWYDAQQSSESRATTEASGKWRRNFSGQASLKDEQLDLLCSLFPDARKFYEDGPGNLWQALWGNVEELWDICKSDRHAGPELPFFESVAYIEFTIYGVSGLNLVDLARSIAIYRIHMEINRLARTDGVGAYRCVRMCLNDANLKQELEALGVHGRLHWYLYHIEIYRLISEDSYRDMVGADDLVDYAMNPQAFCSTEQRVANLILGPTTGNECTSRSRRTNRNFLNFMPARIRSSRHSSRGIKLNSPRDTATSSDAKS